MGFFKQFRAENSEVPENTTKSVVRVDAPPVAIVAHTSDLELREVLLAHLAQVPNLARAARPTGLTPAAWMGLARRDPEFAASMAAAKQEAVGKAEEEAFRRGVTGYERGIWYQGEKVGAEVEYSDAMLGRILQAHHPAYVKKTDISGTIQHNLTWTQIMRIADGEGAVDVEHEVIGEDDLE